MKLTDESWISYQQGKGNEEFQKYMENLTDMQNHVLPYLQSFCSLEEKGVKERREQQVQRKTRAEKLCQELALKQIQQLRMKEKQGKDKPERGADWGKDSVE